MRTVDFVVVGAGSAGCILAARLSEDPAIQVALVEAGAAQHDALTFDPTAWPQLIGSAADWGDLTVPQAVIGKAAMQPHGRGVGGSSSINAMMFLRGHHSSYSWTAREADWSFDALLPYFKRTETAVHGDPDLRGHGGPLRVSPADPPNPVLAALLEAAVQSGHSRAHDVSGGRETGFGPVDLNVVDGLRQSVADAYLTPALHRPNLVLISDGVVERILVEDRRATGVLVRDANDGIVTLRCRRQVVVCAGAIDSPAILMRSGIGPGSALRDNGIEVVHDIAGVGANLHDHPLAMIAYRTGAPVPAERWNYCEVIGLLASEPRLADTPDLQAMFIPASQGFLPGVAPTDPGFGLCVSVVQPHSRGTVRLAGPDPCARPVIDPNYLSDARDVAAMLAGLRAVRPIAAAPAMAPWRPVEATPGAAVTDDESLYAHVAETFSPYFHPVGTCALGDDGVVDGRLRVRGVSGLRVVDASVIPSTPSANPMATVCAIAERAAEWLASE